VSTLVKSFKFIHISDTHLGRNWPVIATREEARIQDYGKAFQYVVDKAIENEVDFILHGGDLIENPTPNIAAMRRLFSELRRLGKNNIEFIITRGSHDSSRIYFEKFGGDFLNILDEEEKLIYVNANPGEKTRTGKDFYDLKAGDGKTIVRIYGLGDYGSEQKNKLVAFSQSFTRKNVDFVILLLHSSMIDRPYSTGAVVSTTDLKSMHGSKLIDYAALGHDHQQFEISDARIYNPGSTEYCSFKEASKLSLAYKSKKLRELGKEIKDKGFYLVEVKDEKVLTKFERIPTKKFLNVEVTFERASPTDVKEGMIEALTQIADKNSFIRPVISGSLAPNYHEYDLPLREIHDSVNAAYIEWPVCELETGSKFKGEVSPEKDYLPLVEKYFEERGWDTRSSKTIADFAIKIVKRMNPAFSTETREEPKESILKIIDDFDLTKVKKK